MADAWTAVQGCRLAARGDGSEGRRHTLGDITSLSSQDVVSLGMTHTSLTVPCVAFQKLSLGKRGQ